MGVIWTSKTRVKQPQILLPVNRYSPLTNSLQFAVNLGVSPLVDVAKGVVTTTTDGGTSISPKKPGFYGAGQIFDHTAYNSCLYAPSWTNVTSEASVCLLFHVNVAGAVGEVWEFGGADTDHFPFGSGAYADVFWASRWMNNVSAPSGASFTAPVCLLFTVKNGSQKAYWNGNLWYSNTATGGFTLPATLKYFKTRTGGQGFAAFAWDRFLSEPEAREISNNPWQLFAPQRTPVFFSLPAAGASSYGLTYRRRLRVQQPQSPVSAAARSSAAWLWAPTVKNDAARNTSVQVAGDPTPVAGSEGLSLRIDSTAKSVSSTEGVRVLGSGSFTLLWRFRQSSTVMNGGSMFSGTGTSGSQNRIDVYSLSSGGMRCDLYDSSGSPVQADAAASSIAVNGLYVLALAYNATSNTLQWYVNGAASGSPATPGTRTGSGATFTFGGNVGGQPANQDYSALAVLDFAVTAQYALSLYVNPWQLFAPSRTPSFFGTTGGGGTTYNISISETASAGEIAGAVAAFLASISETATASETVATTAVLNASISETATASETVAAAASFVVTIGETATASETVAMALGAATFAVDISETATASETVSMLATFGTSISETATASDLVSMLALFQVGISETATASETVAMQPANQTYAVDISETATASDTVVMTIPTTYAISIIETVQAGDYVSMGVPSSDFWTQVTTTQSAGWTIIPTT